ncbi:NAD(P)-dependent dehydrogenase (short-subunit alcohol dehydrogenase family) [Bacillus fengqiuensis]|nr:NAD(P)-dependent dehydrogenase (short-subunit alcohol dehydrogenase family) [Bacillus fengqiuensis]
MIERKSGDIINISSSADQKGAPLTSAYSASKFAVLGLIRVTHAGSKKA